MSAEGIARHQKQKQPMNNEYLWVITLTYRAGQIDFEREKRFLLTT